MVSDDRPIFVISDLHLGDGGPRDNFAVGDREQEFDRFLEYVERENVQLAINGDFFEFWQINLGNILATRKPLLDRLACLQPVYIPGNHDLAFEPLIGANWLNHPFFERMTRPFQVKLGGQVFRFCHGHEVDPFNKNPHPGWGHMLAIFAGIFEEKNESPILSNDETVEETLESFGTSLLQFWNWAVRKFKVAGKGKSVSPKDELTPAQNPSRLQQHLDQMRANRGEEGYDIAIVGHTHRPGRFEDWYCNSGSWTDDTNDFLRIDLDGRIQVLKWVGDHPEQNDVVITP